LKTFGEELQKASDAERVSVVRLTLVSASWEVTDSLVLIPTLREGFATGDTG
jgi:hypothetical protein